MPGKGSAIFGRKAKLADYSGLSTLNLVLFVIARRASARRGNLTVREISSELAYAFGIPLRRYAPRNDDF